MRSMRRSAAVLVAGSNHSYGLEVRLLCCVGSDLCYGLNTHPKESYRVCSETAKVEAATGKKCVGQSAIRIAKNHL